MKRPGHEAMAGDQSLRHERAGALAYTVLASALIPAWSLVDFYLEPALAPRFLGLRLAFAALGPFLFAVIHRTSSLRILRLAIGLEALLTGSLCAYLTATVPSSFMSYAIGTSCVFWGGGLVLRWPARWNVGLFALTFGAYAVAQAAAGAPRSPAEQLSMIMYLVTSAVVGTASGHVSLKLHQRLASTTLDLGRKNDELDRLVASLKDAQTRLVESEKLSALGRLLAGLSHEINNPMNVICNNLDPLRDHVDALTKLVDAARAGAPPADLERLWQELDGDFVRADVADALATIEGAAKRIRTIHSDLRAFVRGEAIAARDGDPNEGVRATVAILRRSVPAGVTLETTYGEVPRLKLNEGQLNQVWLNLLRNALDAVASRGVLRVTTATVGAAVEIAVADDGPGVPPEARGRLFEPFFTTKPAGTGTGLGLATCHQILVAHGGSIALDPDHAPGARFVVRLPVTRANRAA